MELNWLAIGIVTIANFILGALWFGPIFGKIWMRIHHGDKLPSKAEMDAMGKDMWKILLPEFIATALMIIGLACIISAIPQYSGIQNALMVWLAFVMPEAVSTVLWGNDKKSVMPIKIALSASYRLVALVAAGYVLGMW